jgi:hypothetical protein
LSAANITQDLPLGRVGRRILKERDSLLLHHTRESQMPNASTRSVDPKKIVIPISFLRFLHVLAEDSVFVLEPFL